MNFPTQKDVVIAGAGMSGLYTALLLSQKNYRVTVIERRGDPNIGANFEGRSINFTLSHRGLTALGKVGLDSTAIKRAVEVKERVVHLKSGVTSSQSYGKVPGTGLYSISRRELNTLLLDSVRKDPNIDIIFNATCLQLNKAAPSITIRLPNLETRTFNPEFIIGADGVFSAIRQQFQRGESADYEQDFFTSVYKEFNLTSEQSKAIGLRSDGVHVWPRHHSLLLALPNLNGSMTCNLIVSKKGLFSPEFLDDELSLSHFLADHFRELKPYIARISGVLSKKQWDGIITMKTAPWSFEDKVVLVGDAAHTVVHFYAQGLNASLEDCSTLVELLEEGDISRLEAFSKYESVRKPNTDLLAELSKDNFVTLASRSSSPFFEAKVRIESLLAKTCPRIWRTLYSMIAHSSLPYVKAIRVSNRQKFIWRLIGLPFLQFAFGCFIATRRRLTHLRQMPAPQQRERAWLRERKI